MPVADSETASTFAASLDMSSPPTPSMPTRDIPYRAASPRAVNWSGESPDEGKCPVRPSSLSPNGARRPPERRDGSTRRSASAVVLCLALGARVATAGPPATAPSKPEVQTRESQAAMTPSQALDRLKAGNARFVANATRRRDWSAKVVATAAGQVPFAAVLGCMDSISTGARESMQPSTAAKGNWPAAVATTLADQSRRRVEIVFDQGI